MRIIGLLIFYDESPSWLSTCVASLCRFCDHIVAVDGAFMLYPQAKPHSGPDAAAEVVGVCLALQVGVTYHAPQTVWIENEIGKRNFMLDLGHTVAEPGRDWFVVVDADEVVTHVPSDFRDVLAATHANVASYQLISREDWLATERQAEVARAVAVPPGVTPIRAIFRAQPSLHIGMSHYGYATRAADGRPVYLWSRDAADEAIDTDLKVEHRRAHRTKHRLEQADEYYRIRDEHGLEQDPLAETDQWIPA